jgi:transposase InsO family protein
MMPMQGALSVERMCRVGAVSRASFYRWLEPELPVEEEMEVRSAIQAVVLEHRRRYGYRRVSRELRRRGTIVNHKRVARLMREDNLLAVQPRAFTSTTNSGHELEVYMNLAARMKLTGINQLWVADITYIRLLGEFVYLAVVLDAFSRKVVGWTLERTLTARLTLVALKQAIGDRQPPPGLVHHSDRGLQYASEEYVRVLRLHRIVPSMSRPANPYDNAFCESFMRTLKREEIDARSYRNMEELRDHIEEFIERYYNRCRLHSALGYRPPEEFEQIAAVAQPQASGGAAACMSFPRHGEIYPPDVGSKNREQGGSPLPALIGTDESPAGYSLPGCSPAEPGSASPANAMVDQNRALGITKNSKRRVRSIQTVST